MSVTFTHSDGTHFEVPGYFAADGDAANSSAESGTKWRAHFSPDRTGDWKLPRRLSTREAHRRWATRTQRPSTCRRKVRCVRRSRPPSDASGRDLRAQGDCNTSASTICNSPVSGQYFLKVGADAPETLLAYADFDDTIAGNPKKGAAEDLVAARQRLASRRSDLEETAREKA